MPPLMNTNPLMIKYKILAYSFQGISICTNDYLLNRYKIECHIPNSSYVSPDITFNSVESDYNYLEYPDVMEQLLFN